MKNKYKPIIINSLVLLLFVLISCIYFYPRLQGKRLVQSDVILYKGMAHKLDEARQKGQEPLWVDHAFAGMPAYQVGVDYKYNIPLEIIKLKEKLPKPITNLFLYLLGFYVLLLSLNFKPMLSFLGALCFGFSTYLFMILEAGHMTKSFVIATAPLVFAGVFFIFRSKYILGFLITSFFMALHICGNHYQMTYYYMLSIGVLFLVKLVFYIKQNKLKKYFACISVFSLSVLIAILLNLGQIWTTKEYSTESVRGNPQLSVNKDEGKKGLGKDNILAWSYGKLETFNLLIPAFVGGSKEQLDKKSNYYKALKGLGMPDNMVKQYVENAPTYWGSQPFVNGPNYIGSTVIFLFIMACFLVKGPIFWWVIISVIFSILLSWGKNLMFLSEFFIDYFPFYNSFRAVSSILVVVQFVVPFFAIFGLREFIKNRENINIKKSYLKKSIYLLGGFMLFIILFGSNLFDFYNQRDEQMFGNYPFLLDALKQDRASLLYYDSVRSLVFVLLVFSALFMWLKDKISKKSLILILSLLVVLDLSIVDKRYLNKDHFSPKRQIQQQFNPSKANTEIMKDTSIYRVFNTSNTINDSKTSYFHRSLGGYHAAKLQNYQEVYDMHISKNNPQVINMLNAKYIIYNDKGKEKFVLNPDANGNAWIVDSFRIFNTAKEQIEALSEFDLKKVAIVNNHIRKFDTQGLGKKADSLSYVKIKAYKPNEIVYDFNSSKKEMIVFSEIYYPYGWNAYIDGEPVSYFRANYILRGLIVPEGKHQIIFKFEPKAYFMGQRISWVASIIIIVFLFVYIFRYYRNKRIYLK